PAWLPGRINLGIALLNANTPATLARARKIFQEVLRKDPDNPHAHHCLGILLKYEKESGPAIEHFRAVTRIDPEDPAAWLCLGTLLPPGSDEQLECFRKTLDLDPYHLGALNAVQLELGRKGDRKRQMELVERDRRLRSTGWGTGNDIKYTEMGRYAE